MRKKVSLTEIRKHTRKYLRMVAKGWEIVLVDRRTGIEKATLTLEK